MSVSRRPLHCSLGTTSAQPAKPRVVVQQCGGGMLTTPAAKEIVVSTTRIDQQLPTLVKPHRHTDWSLILLPSSSLIAVAASASHRRAGLGQRVDLYAG